MSKIKILSDHLVNQIAAGEVIERPASVVKELVENALDAGATQIEVALIEGGKEKIAVSDNGRGMSFADARLCIERHATSKISCLEDLFKVKSLGFRGEALPSIASVSKLQLTTKDETSEVALRLQIEGGKLVKELQMGAPLGTEMVVEDLFYNTPARKKFLKTASTELSHCSEIVSLLAMTQAKTSFRLTHQGKQVFYYPKTSNLKERVLAVIKAKPEDFKVVENENFPFRLDGYVSKPHVTAHSSKFCYFFVNGRAIRDRTLLHAVTSAYQNVMAHRDYPKVVLFLESEGEDIDVNVHPTKKEVRFKNAHFIHSFVEKSIKSVVNETTGYVQHSQIQNNYLNGSESEGIVKNERETLSEPERAWPERSEGARVRGSADFPLGNPTRVMSSFSESLQISRAFSNLNYIGQLKSSYLLCEDGENLIFIDQHAAHERVAFEKLKNRQASRQPMKQLLLVPITLELSAEEAAVIKDVQQGFEKLGFEIEPFGGSTFVVKAVPQEIHDKIKPEMIRSMIAELKENAKTLVGERVTDHLLSTIACHSARTAKEKLERQEVFALLKTVDALESAHHCPHGRPFSFKVPISELEKRFHR